jgi:hypothetical protein
LINHPAGDDHIVFACWHCRPVAISRPSTSDKRCQVPSVVGLERVRVCTSTLMSGAILPMTTVSGTACRDSRIGKHTALTSKKIQHWSMGPSSRSLFIQAKAGSIKTPSGLCHGLPQYFITCLDKTMAMFENPCQIFTTSSLRFIVLPAPRLSLNP